MSLEAQRRAVDTTRAVIATLKDRSADVTTGTVSWDADVPDQKQAGDVLLEEVRAVPLVLGRTPVQRHGTDDGKVLFEQFVKELEDSVDRCNDIMERMTVDSEQLKRKIEDRNTGIAPQLRRAQALARSSTHAVDGLSTRGDEINTALLDTLTKVVASVSDVDKLFKVGIDEEVQKSGPGSGWWWWSAPKPVAVWSDRSIGPRDAWLREMNVLIHPLAKTRLTKQYAPVLDEGKKAFIDRRVITDPLRSIGVVIASRSRTHLAALAELHRLAMKRVDFRERGDPHVKIAGGLRFWIEGRNTVRQLRVLYEVLTYFPRLPTESQSASAEQMNQIISAVLTNEYFTQLQATDVRLGDQDPPRKRLLRNIDANLTDEVWENILPYKKGFKTRWHMLTVFTADEFRELRDIATGLDANLQPAMTDPDNPDWTLPIGA